MQAEQPYVGGNVDQKGVGGNAGTAKGEVSAETRVVGVLPAVNGKTLIR